MNAIREIEKKIGKELSEIQTEAVFGIENGYVCDEGRNIVGLNLKNTKFFDNSLLSPLTQLTNLDLGRNKISSIFCLSGLTQLKSLNLEDNKISVILHLRSLAQLTSLNLGGNHISSTFGLSNLTQLRSLNLENNRISDISDTLYLTQLTSLNLGINRLSSISNLSNLTQLKDLDLKSNKISDISVLSNFKYLTSLDLNNNKISDISALQNLTQLTSLYLSDNQIRDISSLSHLTQLTNFDLGSNQISNISPLSHLARLTRLNLSGNKISDISALRNLTQLGNLSLIGNQISNILVLQNLTQLTHLNLWGNHILDISPLRSLSQLAILNLSRNPIAEEYPPLQTERDPQKIFAYLTAKKTFVARSKVLFLGEGRAGKTEFSKALLRRNLEEGKEIDQEILQKNFTQVWNQTSPVEYSRIAYENSLQFPNVGTETPRTLGVKDLWYILKFEFSQDDFETLNLKNPAYDRKKLQAYPLHIFDFGGQKMQQVLHRYFISPAFVCIFFRSITPIAEAENDLKKWLKRISGILNQKGNSERLRIVITDINNIKGNVEEMKQSLQSVCEVYGFSHKSIIIKVDSRDGVGLEEFILWITESIEKLELTQSILPEMEILWKDLEKENGTYKVEKEIFQIIDEKRLETNQKEFSHEDILNYLCETTDVFKRITISGEKRVYFTRWLLNNIYTILHGYIETEGVPCRKNIAFSFSKSELASIIGNNYLEVIEVLQQIDFLILERIRGERYLVPELAFARYESMPLGNNQRISAEKVHYCFDFTSSRLPSSLISSFFAKNIKSHDDYKEICFGNRSILVRYDEYRVQFYEEGETLHVKIAHNDKEKLVATVRELLQRQNEVFGENAHCDYQNLEQFLDNSKNIRSEFILDVGVNNSNNNYFIQWKKGKEYASRDDAQLNRIEENTKASSVMLERSQRQVAIRDEVEKRYQNHWVHRFSIWVTGVFGALAVTPPLVFVYLFLIKQADWNEIEPLTYIWVTVTSLFGLLMGFLKGFGFDPFCVLIRFKITREVKKENGEYS